MNNGVQQRLASRRTYDINALTTACTCVKERVDTAAEANDRGLQLAALQGDVEFVINASSLFQDVQALPPRESKKASLVETMESVLATLIPNEEERTL